MQRWVVSNWCTIYGIIEILIIYAENGPSFREWLVMQASKTPAAGDSVAREARMLLAIAQLTHAARLRAQQIEHIRGVAGGLLQTPIVAEAFRAQNAVVHLEATRSAYIRGAMYAELSRFGENAVQVHDTIPASYHQDHPE